MKNLIILFAITTLFLGSCNYDDHKCEKQEITNFKYSEFSIVDLNNGYHNNEYTIHEVVQAYINRIEEIDQNGPSINSVITLNPDALAIANELDNELKSGKKRGPLHGIPVLLKDNINTQDKMPTTAGSRALINSYPLQDSWVAAKLREAGAVIIGKTNLSEWANFRGQMSVSGWSGVGGQTKNPYVLDRNPCGSSSGSGASVSANLCMVAIGTETNGSILCPSQANGIVGIKPTVGLISRSGIIPISFTQDTPGPMARSVADAVACLSTMVGIDSTDSKTLSNSFEPNFDYTQYLNDDGLEGKRIGLYLSAMGTHYKVDVLMEQAIAFLKKKGATIIDIPKIYAPVVEEQSFEVMLFEYKDGLNNYFKSLGENAPIKTLDDLIAFNETDSIELKYFNQAYLKMAKEKDGLNSKEYLDALKKMQKGMQQDGIDKVMNEHNLDAIIAPTGSPAWKTDNVNGDFYMLGSSSAAAIAGYPSITVPMGFINELPVGISFFGKAWSEPILIEIAHGYEVGTKHRKAPKFLN